MSKRTIREKLLAYLSIQTQTQNSRYFEIPLGRVELAEYLCVDRSGYSDHPGLCVVNPGNETGGFPEYERIGAADSQISGLNTRICP